jgi:hypothetical protein
MKLTGYETQTDIQVAGCLGSVILGGHLRECHILSHLNLYGRTCSIPHTANHYRHKLFELASANLDIENLGI